MDALLYVSDKSMAVWLLVCGGAVVSRIPAPSRPVLDSLDRLEATRLDALIIFDATPSIRKDVATN